MDLNVSYLQLFDYFPKDIPSLPKRYLKNWIRSGKIQVKLKIKIKSNITISATIDGNLDLGFVAGCKTIAETIVMPPINGTIFKLVLALYF